MNAQQLSGGELSYEKSKLMSIIRQLEKKQCISSSMGKSLKDNCRDIYHSYQLGTYLRKLLYALILPAESSSSVTTRSSLSAEGNSLLSEIKGSAQMIQVSERNNNSFRTKFNKEEDVLKMGDENVEVNFDDLMKEFENIRQELTIVKEKNIEMAELIIKKNADVKESQRKYESVVRTKTESEEYIKLHRKKNELTNDLADTVKKVSELVSSIKGFESRRKQRKSEIKELKKQIRNLRFHCWLDASPSSKYFAERTAVAEYLMFQDTQGIPKELKATMREHFKPLYPESDSEDSVESDSEDSVESDSEDSVESDSEDSDDSHSFPVKKHKVAEKVSISVPISKKPSQLSSSVAKGKSSTPLRKIDACGRKYGKLKTPSSVYRLMSMPRKSEVR